MVHQVPSSFVSCIGGQAETFRRSSRVVFFLEIPPLQSEECRRASAKGDEVALAATVDFSVAKPNGKEMRNDIVHLQQFQDQLLYIHLKRNKWSKCVAFLWFFPEEGWTRSRSLF